MQIHSHLNLIPSAGKASCEEKEQSENVMSR